MRAIAVAIAAAGCVQGSSDSHRLSEDVTYLGIVPPFDSAEQCVRDADDPRTCSLALTFCKSGLAARRTGTLLEMGTYYADRDKTIVHAFIGVSEVFFDVAAVAEVGSTMRWQTDETGLSESFLFETIDCTGQR